MEEQKTISDLIPGLEFVMTHRLSVAQIRVFLLCSSARRNRPEMMGELGVSSQRVSAIIHRLHDKGLLVLHREGKTCSAIVPV